VAGVHTWPPWWPAAALLVLLVLVALVAWWLLRPRATTTAQPVAYGLDFSWGRPSVPAILAGGYTFVLRYLSWSTTGKNLTKAEADSYLAAGIKVCSNWEYYADACLGGYWQGYDDAVEAARQHTACGGPPDAPIYFSVDWDCQDWEYPAVYDYFTGVADVIGRERTAAYGGYDPIRWLYNDSMITYGWQTYAWSGGKWDARAQIRQVQNGITVDGADCDRNEAWAADYGAWGQTTPPLPEGAGVLLTHPQEKDRLDLFTVGPGGRVEHRWLHSPTAMADLWSGKGVAYEDLTGGIYPGTLYAAWLTDASGVYVCGLGAPGDATAPVGLGQYWGCTIYTSGKKSGWGTIEGAYGPIPGAASVDAVTPAPDSRL
jgi:glycoside hydrolase-like protein